MTESTTDPTTLDIQGILKALPHRYPFLMVDRVLELSDDGKSIVALKNVTANEPHFTGHFPERPIMPGVLQIEALAQTAAIAALVRPENKGKLALFGGVDGVKFRHTVVPGDQLRLEVIFTAAKRGVIKADGRATVDGKLACSAKLTCMMVDVED